VPATDGYFAFVFFAAPPMGRVSARRDAAMIRKHFSYAVWPIVVGSAAFIGCSGDDNGSPSSTDAGADVASEGAAPKPDAGADAGGQDGTMGSMDGATSDASQDGTMSSKDSEADTGGSDGGGDTGGQDGGGQDAGSGTGMVATQTQLPGSSIPQFVTPVTALSGTRVDGAAAVTVVMQEFQQKVLPAQLYPTTGQFAAGTYLWGYNVNGAGPTWPGRTIEAQQGTDTIVQYSNELNQPFLQQFLPVDLTIHWADPLHVSANNQCIAGDENGGDFFTDAGPDGNGGALAQDDAGFIGGTQNAVPPACQLPYAGVVPAVPHLHGAEVLSAFDGHPDSWFTPGAAIKGPGFVSTTYDYPNQQEATTLWFHDHSLGTTRLNVYSGLEAFYLIRDGRDTGLTTNSITLPGGAFEQELIIADRMFDTNGQLIFPSGSLNGGTPAGDAGPDAATPPPIGLEGAPANPNLHPFAIPEFFGDVMTVNGQSWPYIEVQPRRYRFRIVNGSNARFLQMQLFQEATTAGGAFTGISTLFTDTANPPVGVPGPAIWQIGSDGGFLNAPVNVDVVTAGVPATGDPNSPHLFMAPAERADIIVDFGGQAGKRFVLSNTAVAPFPGGGVPTMTPDGTPEVLPAPAQQGPTAGNANLPGPYEITDQVMEFRVDQPMVGTDTSFNPAGAHPALRATPIVDIKPADTGLPVDARRQLVLDEVEDVATGGPVEVIIENAHWNGLREGSSQVIGDSTSNGAGLEATEVPREGATELWEVANLSPDAHPLHIHLIQFQIINSQPLNTEPDLCPHVSATPQFGADGDGRFDFTGPEYRAAWDAVFPGGTFNGFQFEPGNFIPGYGPPLPYLTPNADGAIGGNPAFGSVTPFPGNATSFFVGPAVAPQPRDQGWKDTAKMFPCAVTRLAVRWAPQDLTAASTHAGTNYFPFDPTTGGPGYVWHCHILDHEDNEMMRPLLIAK
jgi:FtsP/CotA-like multicopper oxidase with cupredoxin domain